MQCCLKVARFCLKIVKICSKIEINLEGCNSWKNRRGNERSLRSDETATKDEQPCTCTITTSNKGSFQPQSQGHWCGGRFVSKKPGQAPRWVFCQPKGCRKDTGQSELGVRGHWLCPADTYPGPTERVSLCGDTCPLLHGALCGWCTHGQTGKSTANAQDFL